MNDLICRYCRIVSCTVFAFNCCARWWWYILFFCAFLVTMANMVGRFLLHRQPSYRAVMHPSSDIDITSFHDDLPLTSPLVSIKDIVLHKSSSYICTVPGFIRTLVIMSSKTLWAEAEATWYFLSPFYSSLFVMSG